LATTPEKVWCVASVPAATWNLHTTQPKYFAPTCSEVVNLIGLLRTKDKHMVWKKVFVCGKANNACGK
jgi:hypothetical protein